MSKYENAYGDILKEIEKQPLNYKCFDYQYKIFNIYGIKGLFLSRKHLLKNKRFTKNEIDDSNKLLIKALFNRGK